MTLFRRAVPPVSPIPPPFPKAVLPEIVELPYVYHAGSGDCTACGLVIFGFVIVEGASGYGGSTVAVVVQTATDSRN